MKINKNTVLKYIYNGKYKNIKCLFKQMYFDKIPLYISSDVECIKALQLDDCSILVIINDKLDTRYSESIIEILIMLNILMIYFKELEDKSLVYVYCAYWYGFNNTINIIKNIINISDEEKIKLISLLESILKNKHNIQIPSKEGIIESLKYVSID